MIKPVSNAGPTHNSSAVSTQIDEGLARDIEEYANKPLEEIRTELAASGIDAKKTIEEVRVMIATASIRWRTAAASSDDHHR